MENVSNGEPPQADNRTDAERAAVRSMKLEDIPAIEAIEQEAFTVPWSADAFHNEIVNNQLAYYLVLELDSEIVSYGGMWTIMDEAHVTNIAVKAGWRGRKLGDRMLRELMATAEYLGMRRMTLEVRVSNLTAQGLYEKYGFRAIGVRKGYYSDNNEDAIVMWTELTENQSKEEE